MMDQLDFEQDMAFYPHPSSGSSAMRGRNHRRAATEGSFDFLYEQQRQEQKQQHRISSADNDPFGLGPAAPPKPDLLNTMAHSFLKEEQHRLLGTSGIVDPARTGPALIHSESASSTLSTSTPPYMDGLASSPAPLLSPAAPAVVFASEDEMMELAMAVEPVPAPTSFYQAPPPQIGMDVHPMNIQTIPTFSLQPMDTLETDGMQGDGDQPQPSRLSRFLDSLQAVADQQNAMLQEQLRLQQQQRYAQSSTQFHRPRGHRRAVSEGPNHFDLTMQQQNWPSFQMSDRTEEAAIFMANQEPTNTFY